MDKSQQQVTSNGIAGAAPGQPGAHLPPINPGAASSGSVAMQSSMVQQQQAGANSHLPYLKPQDKVSTL